MKITKVEFASDKTIKTNATSATLEVFPNAQTGAVARVTFQLTGGGTRQHDAAADDRDDLWSLAECMLANLEGGGGRNATREYYQAMEMVVNAAGVTIE